MKKKTYIALLLAFTLTTAGCGDQNSDTVSASIETQAGTENSVGLENNTSPDKQAGTENSAGSENKASENSAAIDTGKIFSDGDYKTEYEEGKSAAIQLNGSSATCSSDAVQISDSTVTITDEGTYIFSGTLDDGMIIVNADKSDKVRLVLNNVTIHSKTCAPIYILEADKVFITMAAGSANTLSNGGMFTAIDENNIDAVIFSKEDVTLNGSGTLLVTSPAGHGIVSKDSLKITGGSYDINCSFHAISGKDDVCITNADVTVTAGKDGIRADHEDDASRGYVYIQSGTFHIAAEGDGISASSCLQIEDGSFDITAGGGSVNAAAHNSDFWGDFPGGGRHGGGQMDGELPKDGIGKRDRGDWRNGDTQRNERPFETPDDASDSTSDGTSMKGIKASAGLLINGGDFTIDSADDSFHSNGSVTVNGGTFKIASGDDAFHADETLTVTAGTINISESYEGLEGTHINVSGGDITLTATDDGVNAAGGTDFSGSTGGRDGKFGNGKASSAGGTITISGGVLKITASGDGMDANGTLAITGGHITVSGPTRGDTATLDYDATGTISGGTFIGTGASGMMAQTFSDSEQGVITANVGAQSAGTQIQLSDRKGNSLITYTPDLDFELVILSSPDIISGETYTLTIGEYSSEFTAG